MTSCSGKVHAEAVHLVFSGHTQPKSCVRSDGQKEGVSLLISPEEGCCVLMYPPFHCTQLSSLPHLHNTQIQRVRNKTNSYHSSTGTKSKLCRRLADPPDLAGGEYRDKENAQLSLFGTPNSSVLLPSLSFFLQFPKLLCPSPLRDCPSSDP